MKNLLLLSSLMILFAFWSTYSAALGTEGSGADNANFNALQQKIIQAQQLSQNQIKALQTSMQNEINSLNDQLQAKIKNVQTELQQQIQQLQQQINKLGATKGGK